MKKSRAAAILAGSAAAMGVAAPAMAAQPPSAVPMSLNGGIAHVASTLPQLDDVTQTDQVLGQTTDAVMELNNLKGNAPEQVLKTAAATTPMLGGVSLGG
ncbi:hypothetical protein NPS70_15525 [Streptomyces sp. C10-9-1]|uniref:hypothetical protein n=1 Tax=Streptomyces sp. C10-9-1 TaxID=1859285 RepID=UPI0021136ED0|nr:hypothetical protein [Streptomyces sp. C10-9-1]MCQ6554597.1 hypothetical protein [Streptomyces sp. C10-9-1]